jgi:hypothetical protein
LRAAPRADPDVRISRIRLLAQVIAASVDAVCRSSSLHSSARPCVRRMGEPNCIALAPPPSLHSLRPSHCWFVRELHWYYAAVRLPGCVHRRRTVLSFPTRSALDCSTAVDCSMANTPRLSRFPYMMRLCMLRSPTPPSSCHSCQSEWQDVAFRALGPHRHSKVARLFRGSILGLHIPCQRFTGVVTTASA